MFHPAFSLHTNTKPCTKHYKDFEQTPPLHTQKTRKDRRRTDFFSLVSKKRFQKNSYECMKLLQHSIHTTIAVIIIILPKQDMKRRRSFFFVCSFSIYLDVVVVDDYVCSYTTHNIEKKLRRVVLVCEFSVFGFKIFSPLFIEYFL